MLDLLGLVVHFPAGQRHSVGENSAVLVNGDVIRHFLKGQSVLGLVLPDHNEHNFVVPGHELLEGRDIQDYLVCGDGHIQSKQLVKLVGFSLLAFGDVVGDQNIWHIVAGHRV